MFQLHPLSLNFSKRIADFCGVLCMGMFTTPFRIPLSDPQLEARLFAGYGDPNSRSGKTGRDPQSCRVYLLAVVKLNILAFEALFR